MASRTPAVEERSPCRFSASLSSAVSEWILIFLLFLNGFFSYLVKNFARYCKLQTPCLFCSRFDHVLDCESPSFYDNLICTSHKLEISSLAYCHIHRKLGDVRETCEACLLSFATEKKSNSDTYRSLVGKLEINHNEDSIIPKSQEIAESDGSQTKFHAEDTAQLRTPLFRSSRVSSFKLKNDDVFGLLTKRLCSCCTEPFRMRSHAHRLLQTKSVGADVAEPDVPVLGLTPRDRSVSRDAFNKRNELIMIPHASNGGHGFDKLSHIGYKELKITSDSESEVPISDDDDGNTLIERPANVKEETVSHRVQPDPPSVIANTLSKTPSDDITPKQLIQADPIMPDILLTVPEKHVVHTDALSDSPLYKLNIARSHGLEELNWDEVGGGHHPTDSDNLSHPIATKVSNAKDIIDISEAACPPSPVVEVSKASSSTETILKPSHTSNDPILPFPNVMDLNDAYKLVIVSKGNEHSPTDSSRVPEDLKLLLTQISRGLECPWNDMTLSPRMRGLVRQDSKISEGSGTSGQPNLTKRLSLERNESGFEYSLDGSIFCEIDGESAVDKLKQHVELDRKSLSILYKELEEERSASAIAANQAMAMITRLQEEKAAMQMEALQYQRMMEEQAEYDQEALQKQYDLLAEREKEIQDLEAELASYRRRFVNDYGNEEAQSLMADKEEKGISKVSTPSAKQFPAGPKTPKSDSFLLDLDMNKSTTLRDSLLDFEEEKLYISERLKELEKKLHLCSNKVLSSDSCGDGLPDCETKVCESPVKQTSEKDETEQLHLHEEENNKIADSAFSFPKDLNVSIENSRSNASIIVNNHEDGSSPPALDHQTQQSSTFTRETDTTTIEHEIYDLNHRLESLEADRYFLEHMINSLQNGKEGLLFVQQIAHHLQELRKIGIS